MSQIGTKKAAMKAKISERRIRQLIDAEILPASKVGRDWLIDTADLRLLRGRKVGRPKKSKK